MTATDNYWNTIDTDIIDSMIYDKNDDLNCAGYIEYEPFLTEPHPDTQVDTTEPVITSLSNDTTPTQSKTWAWDATDSHSVTFRYLIDQNETWSNPSGTYSETKTATKSGVDGIWYIHVQAKDALGNESDVTTVSAILDNTAPTAAISGAPSSPTNQTGATLTIGGEGVTHYKYKLDDGDYSSETAVGTDIALTNLDDGSHTVYVLGRDSAENWQAEANATTATWTVDTVPPTPSVSGAATSLTFATITVGGEGVTLYKYKLDDEEIYSDEIPVTTEIGLTDLAEGSHTVYVIVCDAAGNWQSEDDATSFTWTVDITPPTADAGPDQTVDEAVTVTLDGSNSTDDEGIHRYLWTQTVGTPVTLSDATDVKPTFVTPPVDSNGTHLEFLLTIIDITRILHTDKVSIDVDDNGITGFPADVLPTESSTGKNMGIKVESGGSVTAFMMVIPSSLPDTTNMPEDFIYGLISMQLKPDTAGGTVRVTVYLANPAPEAYKWYKYGTNDGWYDFSDYAEFNDDRDQVTLTLTDGGIGDDDGAANGVIVDPSGLGTLGDGRWQWRWRWWCRWLFYRHGSLRISHGKGSDCIEEFPG